MSKSPVLSLKNIAKSFKQGKEELQILVDATVEIMPGETVALVGPSGSGKSTLLQIAGLLDRPTSGTIIINGTDCSKVGDRTRTRTRKQQLGFVYQFHHLLPEFTALENVALPLRIQGVSKKKSKEQATEILQSLGLESRLSHTSAQLSGGEQQRVAIARAMVKNPALILADEPTGNLDPHTADDVFALFMTAVQERNQAAFIVTHNLDLAKKMDRVIMVEEGVLVSGGGK